MTRDDRKRIFAKYSSTIEHAEKKCVETAKLSQDAWEREDEVAAHAADRENLKWVRVVHANILQRSIDLGSVEELPGDQELLAVLKLKP